MAELAVRSLLSESVGHLCNSNGPGSALLVNTILALLRPFRGLAIQVHWQLH